MKKKKNTSMICIVRGLTLACMNRKFKATNQPTRKKYTTSWVQTNRNEISSRPMVEGLEPFASIFDMRCSPAGDGTASAFRHPATDSKAIDKGRWQGHFSARVNCRHRWTSSAKDTLNHIDKDKITVD